MCLCPNVCVVTLLVYFIFVSHFILIVLVILIFVLLILLYFKLL